MAAMGKGGKKTPAKVIELINNEVSKIGQNAAARAIGLPLYSIQKYMTGITEPTNASLDKLAEYFNVSVAYLRGFDELKKMNIHAEKQAELANEELLANLKKYKPIINELEKFPQDEWGDVIETLKYIVQVTQYRNN
jgi:transcriptional regulator with XRE-family HTH domain